MTRRHDALIPLTHDHHHALRNARLLREAAEGSDEQRLEAAKVFCGFFRGHSVQHFREEEEVIFPLVALREGAPHSGILHILEEHVQLHALVQQLEREIDDGRASAETMRTIAATLQGHVRYEEDELFPAIERLVGEDLSSVQLPPRDRSA